MKRYIRLDWDQYYPSGGLGNISGTFDTLEEAIAFAPGYPCDYSEVVDRDTDETLWEKG